MLLSVDRWFSKFNQWWTWNFFRSRSTLTCSGKNRVFSWTNTMSQVLKLMMMNAVSSNILSLVLMGFWSVFFKKLSWFGKTFGSILVILDFNLSLFEKKPRLLNDKSNLFSNRENYDFLISNKCSLPNWAQCVLGGSFVCGRHSSHPNFVDE